MIISHNLLAMNAQRQFGINNGNRNKSLEKLSSGYKVNRAADDAAGLSISEKLRRQIRGLHQGENNIQDGISMIQVAEGAMGEITECLQRMNELSIKAYNDTNQMQDRNYIQQEINQLITEIDRIADTTTFNEIPLLKGNPKETVQVEPGRIYSGVIYKRYETEIPAWLKVSKELNQQNSVDFTDAGLYSNKLDRTSNAVFQTQPGKYTYYGSENTTYNAMGYTYGGLWSNALADKASAVIDFSGLSNVENASELYTNLFNLLGTSIGVPCGTCTEYYGISFSGSEMGLVVPDRMISYQNGTKAPDTCLNLSEWKPYAREATDKADRNIFEVVKEFGRAQALDTSSTEEQKKAQVQALAKELARKISEECSTRLSETISSKSHFNKFFSTNDSKIVIYDYRDTDKLENVDTADSRVQTSSFAWAKVPKELVFEGDWIEIQSPINIQCSAQLNDKISIDLPYVGSLAGYSIDFYEKETTYSEDYQKKLREWEKDGFHFEKTTETLPGRPAYTKTTKVPSLDFDRNGEIITKWKEVSIEVPEVLPTTIKKTKKVIDKPKPEPKPEDIIVKYTYKPDSVNEITKALQYVSECRSNLGAQQNRLEHAYRANTNNEENTTAAESRIRDTDMANEMLKLSGFNILNQVGQAMMAQANQSNQGVLNLLS